MALNNLGLRLSDLGQREAALDSTREAIETLFPYFRSYPAAFADWMKTMVGNYLKLVEDLGQDPDADLLMPIVEILQSLETDTGAGDPAAPG